MSQSGRDRMMMHIAIAAILVLALVGMALAIGHVSSAGLMLFELITFSVGIAALILAVLGSVTSAYQMRVIRRISKEMHTAINELKDIDKTNEAINHRLDQEYELAKDIAEALHEAGVVAGEEKRHAVARSIERKVRTNSKQTSAPKR